MEIKYQTIPFNPSSFTKAEDKASDRGEFEGYGSMFGNIDFGGDMVMPGAFDKSLAEWNEKGVMPQLLGFHRNGNVIGDWLEMREDSKGLYVKGKLWVNGDSRLEEAQKAYNILKGTGPKGLSIGYSIEDYEVKEHERGQYYELKELKLYEVSVVGFGMNPQALVTGVKKMIDDEGNLLSKRDIEKILRDAGLSTKQSKAFLAGGFSALVRDEEERSKAAHRDDELESDELSQQLNNLLQKMELDA